VHVSRIFYSEQVIVNRFLCIAGKSTEFLLVNYDNKIIDEYWQQCYRATYWLNSPLNVGSRQKCYDVFRPGVGTTRTIVPRSVVLYERWNMLHHEYLRTSILRVSHSKSSLWKIIIIMHFPVHPVYICIMKFRRIWLSAYDRFDSLYRMFSLFNSNSAFIDAGLLLCANKT